MLLFQISLEKALPIQTEGHIPGAFVLRHFA